MHDLISSDLSRRELLRQGALLAAGTAAGLFSAGEPADGDAITPVAQKKPVLYLIATAHNDTQWNWTVQDTIRSYVPNTMYGNFKLFQKFPTYVFNYEGGIHYMFFQEYHPEDWHLLQEWVAMGRWRLSGSWLNAVDVNLPSPESLFRHALYTQAFFRREFGRISRDIYLPDCFGFGYALPAIAHHSGLRSFSTQKLSWGGWVPAPFAVGRWEGSDGSEIVAALRCGSYVEQIKSDPSTDLHWNSDLSDAGDIKVGFRYFGVGDQGGAPDETSVHWAEIGGKNVGAPVRVVNTGADQIARDLTPEEFAALPSFNDELIMTRHGSGCYTSQSAMKRYNRANEVLAAAAEQAAVAAEWLGGPAYPDVRLTDAWIRVLWHQAHDDLTGTSIPQAYTFSWNDELIALNQFAQILTSSVAAIASGLDTRAAGVPIVVQNPLSIKRTDLVEATVPLPAETQYVRVFDSQSGKELPAQLIGRTGNECTLIFAAEMLPLSWHVFDARPSAHPSRLNTGLSVTESRLESRRYRVDIDENGDVSGIYDKANGYAMLASPMRLQHLPDRSSDWPAWELLWDDLYGQPGTFPAHPSITVEERGPARISLRITRRHGDSTFVQRVRLAAAGEWVEIHNDVDWKTPAQLVKATFPLAIKNPKATFDLGVGVIERPNATKERYEVPAQRWVDLTDVDGQFGVALLSDQKAGWDKPDDHLLRLTLLRTPQAPDGWEHQRTNDIGRHQFSYGVTGHPGDWRSGQVPHLADRFNQPLLAFHTARHTGSMGRQFSFLSSSTEQVAVRALKKLDASDEVVIRIQELHGRTIKGVRLKCAIPVVSAREINAAEEIVGPCDLINGAVSLDMDPFRPRAFALKLAPLARLNVPKSLTLALEFNEAGVSPNSDRKAGDFDGLGHTFPAELLPEVLEADGIPFKLGVSVVGAKNVLACRGQSVNLPQGEHNRCYLLAAAVGDDRPVEFHTLTPGGSRFSHNLIVHEWTGLIGQWYSRLAYNHPDGGDQVVSRIHDGHVVDREKIKPAFVKRANIAWIGTHRHRPDGDDARIFCYLFKYCLDVLPGTAELQLPNDPRIKILAVTVSNTRIDSTLPAGLLFEKEEAIPFAPDPGGIN